MNNLNFWSCTGLMMVLLATGCAASRPSKTIEEGIGGAKPAAAQSDTAQTGMPLNGAKHPGEGSPGIVVHLDPNTGEFLPEPPHEAVTQRATPENAASPALQFFEVPSAVLGGGVMIELNRHFATPLVATMDGDGRVILKHQNYPTESENK